MNSEKLKGRIHEQLSLLSKPKPEFATWMDECFYKWQVFALEEEVLIFIKNHKDHYKPYSQGQVKQAILDMVGEQIRSFRMYDKYKK